MPVLYLLLAYPTYLTIVLAYVATGRTSMIENIQVLDTIGIIEILVSFALSLAVGAIVIKVLLNNKYSETRKAVAKEQAEAAKSGAPIDEFKLAQVAEFDKAYTKAMVAFAILDAFFVTAGIIAASFFYGQFGVLAVDIVVAIFSSALLGVVLEKGARLVGDGSLTKDATDHFLAVIDSFRQRDIPSDDKKEVEGDLASVIAQATASAIEATLSKLGKA